MLLELYSRLEQASTTAGFGSIVEGKGNTAPVLVLVGEAPGRMEAKTGIPFVGSAGKQLNQFLEILNIKREDIYITNAVKIRPTKISKKNNTVNRAPNAKEINFFKPFLHEELTLLSPKIICSLGNTALNAITGDMTIGDCHGKPIRLDTATLFPLYHPASVIYKRDLLQTYIDDLQKLKFVLEEYL